MSVRKSLAWSYGAQAFIFVQTFAVSVFVARILGPYEMGIFAVAATTAGALSIISSFGVGTYLVRHAAPDATLRATAFTVNAILNILVSLVIASVVLLGAQLNLNSGVREVLLLLAITPLISIFDFLPSTFMQREMNFKVISFISMCRAVITSVMLLSLALSGLGYLSPAIAAVVATLFGTCAVNVAARQHASLRIALTGWRDLSKFGMQMMSIGGLAQLTLRLSELILSHFLGIAALGIYSRASSLANQIWDNVYGLSTRVIFAQMAKEMRETGTVRRTFIHGLAIICALIAPFVMGLAVLSLPLVRTLYGDKWIEAAVPLSMLMLVHFISLGFGMNWELCVLRNRTGWQARNEGIRSVVGLIAFTIGALLNVAAAAGGRLFEACCGLLLFGPKMREMAGTAPGEILRIVRQSLALTVAAVGPSFALMVVMRWSSYTPWSLICCAIAAGVLMWFALLRKLNHPLLAEITRAAHALKNGLQRSTPRDGIP